MTTYFYRCSIEEAQRIIKKKEIHGASPWDANAGPFFTIDQPPQPGTWIYDRGNVLDPNSAVVLEFKSNRSGFPAPITRQEWINLADKAKSNPSVLIPYQGRMVHMDMQRPDQQELVATVADTAPNALSLVGFTAPPRVRATASVSSAAQTLINANMNYISIVTWF